MGNEVITNSDETQFETADDWETLTETIKKPATCSPKKPVQVEIGNGNRNEGTSNRKRKQVVPMKGGQKKEDNGEQHVRINFA